MSNTNMPAFALGTPDHPMDGFPDFIGDALRLVQQLFLLPTGPRAAVFAGLEHGCGCTSICAAVATIIVRQTQGSVCLVETNLRSPALAEKFGIKNVRGLSDAMEQGGSIEPFLSPIPDENLWLLAAGSKTAAAGIGLSSNLMGQWISELKSKFDFVIIDAAPLNESSDVFALGPFTDGVVLVIEAGKTRREFLRMAESNLKAAGIPILAGVLNKRTFPIPEFIYRRL